VIRVIVSRWGRVVAMCNRGGCMMWKEIELLTLESGATERAFFFVLVFLSTTWCGCFVH